MTGASSRLPRAISDWIREQGWRAFDFQKQVWQAMLAGQSGLLHASTGSGKTYAVWLGALARVLALSKPASVPEPGKNRKQKKSALRVLWITPMRALTADTALALARPLSALLPAWQLGVRTGDTAPAERARQNRRLPEVLITTPESLSLLLSRPQAAADFAALDMVIVDEWHELLGSKRGVQVQLALARLQYWRPGLLRWGLSATLGDLNLAAMALCGMAGHTAPVIVEGKVDKEIVLDTLLPDNVDRFPWAGHLGLTLLPKVIEEVGQHATTLIFTNTRSQSELWYQGMLDARPDWAGLIALHHGSLDKSVRQWVEASLKNGTLKAVVCTSSLDLGVDFYPVERVFQIGSAKGVARLLQRAGRSGHQPGSRSRVTLVPTHSLEILEAAGAQQALRLRHLESRIPPEKPYDVLVQHVITVALSDGFDADQLFQEIRNTWSYRHLDKAEWNWILDFSSGGGKSLQAYPEYRRIARAGNQPASQENDQMSTRPVADMGRYSVPDAAVARRHRLNIGTIVADAAMQVQYLRGGRIGTIEESFISRMHPGDTFLFGGRMLEFVRIKEMTVYVKRALNSKGAIPRWSGGRMPMSSELANATLLCLDQAAQGQYPGAEMQAVAPLLMLQQSWSALPGTGTLPVEIFNSREGQHLLIYPFAGRSVHTGLGSLLAWRLASQHPVTFSISVNDYGFELLHPGEHDFEPYLTAVLLPALLNAASLSEDILASLNTGELAQRRFREIARVAGLLAPSYPGQARSARQLQASSSLFFQVFSKHDPENLLLAQARQEVLQDELDIVQLSATLDSLRQRKIVVCHLKKPSPFAFPLIVQRLREKLSTEKLHDRITRMLRELEAAADPRPKSLSRSARLAASKKGKVA